MNLEIDGSKKIGRSIKVYKYKDYVLEYRPKLGYVFLKKEEEICTVYYCHLIKELSDLFKKDISDIKIKGRLLEMAKKDESRRKNKNS